MFQTCWTQTLCIQIEFSQWLIAKIDVVRDGLSSRILWYRFLEILVDFGLIAQRKFRSHANALSFPHQFRCFPADQYADSIISTLGLLVWLVMLWPGITIVWWSFWPVLGPSTCTLLKDLKFEPQSMSQIVRLTMCRQWSSMVDEENDLHDAMYCLSQFATRLAALWHSFRLERNFRTD